MFIIANTKKYVIVPYFDDMLTDTVGFLQAGSDLYAFVEFAEHREAQLALMAMNKRIVLGRVTKIFLFYFISLLFI